jgi:RNA polymerase sigma-54 factor
MPENVLSDDAIVDLLRDEGIEIARRTVAKYREGLNIASSVQRRREKKALATGRKSTGTSGFMPAAGVESFVAGK